METASITDLLRDPKGVIRKLERARDVLIERRDAAPLRLTLSARVDEDREGTAVLARLLLRALPNMTDAVWEPLVESYPWLRFLPEKERPTFVREFAETVAGCASLGNNAPLAQMLHEWRATAEVYSDPSLAAVLKRPTRGSGPKVSRPPQAGR